MMLSANSKIYELNFEIFLAPHLNFLSYKFNWASEFRNDLP